MRNVTCYAKAWALGLMIGTTALFSACTVESELTYADGLTSVEQAKAQIMDLANKYGLTVELNDSIIAEQVAARTFSLKETEKMLQDFSGIVGVYYNQSNDSNSLSFNIEKEQLLMHSRLSATPEREEELDSTVTGGLDKVKASYGIVKFYVEVSWSYNPKGGSGEVSVDISEFEPTSKYSYNVTNKDFHFTGANKVPTYSFDVVCWPSNSSFRKIIFSAFGDNVKVSIYGRFD